MEDLGEHKNLGVSVVGDLSKKEAPKAKGKTKQKRVTKKRVAEGTVNKGTRITKLEYLQYHVKSVATTNEKGEHEIKPTKYCKEGDVVWVLEDDNTFTRTEIY